MHFVLQDACVTRWGKCMVLRWCLCAAAALMARRRAAGGCCCPRAPMNEDNARFCLLAALIFLYMLCGAAIFSALEHPFELRARSLWKEQLENFTRRYRVNLGALHTLLRQYEEANGAGIRVGTLRPRWDFSGAFYFVGTVVSTIGQFMKFRGIQLVRGMHGEKAPVQISSLKVLPWSKNMLIG